MGRCIECDGRLDRPGLYGCDEVSHPKPTMSQIIVSGIEADMRDRRGLRQAFEGIDVETQDEIRDAWVKIVSDQITRRLTERR